MHLIQCRISITQIEYYIVKMSNQNFLCVMLRTDLFITIYIYISYIDIDYRLMLYMLYTYGKIEKDSVLWILTQYLIHIWLLVWHAI